MTQGLAKIAANFSDEYPRLSYKRVVVEAAA